MVSMKKLAEKYLQGNLSNMEKEHLLYLIKNDQNVDEWVRTSIEMADEVIPDIVRDRVINNVFRSNTTAPAIRSRMLIWKRVMMICSVMVAMCVGAAVYHYTFRVDHMTGMFEVATNIGERSNVTLPDGTHVVLNAKTKLQYNYSMIDGKRKVFLQGEAFFDVEEDTDHPFIVYANDVEVECLGTSFNVRNHEEEQTVSVVLVEGKVRVQAGAAELLMEPDNRMVFDKHTLALSKHRVDSDNYLCWLNNEVRYNNQTLEEIAGELARNYNIRIVITSDELKKERFTGYLGQSSLRNVLEVLSMTSGIRYYYDTDTVYLHKRI